MAPIEQSSDNFLHAARIADQAQIADLAAEVERLHGLIARAPHARHCDAGSSLFPGSCSCWKKNLLRPLDNA